MKLKVYNIAAMACVCLIALGGNSFAQDTIKALPTTKSEPSARPSTTPRPAIAPRGAISINGQNISGYTAYAPAASVYTLHNGTLSPLASVNGTYYLDAFGGSQDTVYQKKMKKLQEQMSAVQKEMSALRVEESKKRNEEMVKRNAERQADLQKKYADAFAANDKKFAEKFAYTLRSTRTTNDADIEKKVASGDVKLKTKSYTKTYAVDANDKLAIDNRFGKITVNAWNKNEIKVDVEIKAYADDDDQATELLNSVSINDNKTDAGVSFITKIDEGNRKNSLWGTMTSNGKTSVRKTVINYTVYMPTKNSLNITNTYGAIVLPDMSGKLTLKNSFGNLSAKTLTNVDNSIKLSYGNADIQSLTGGDLNVSFGALSLLSGDKLTGDFKYTPVKIGNLTGSGNFTVHFGEGLQINKVDKNVKTLLINATYAPVKLTSLTDADFNVSTSYGDFTYNDKVNITSKTPADDTRSYGTSKTYKGHVGKGDSDKQITIKSTFSSVKFDQ